MTTLRPEVREKIESIAYEICGDNPFPNTEAEKLWFYEDRGIREGAKLWAEQAERLASALKLYSDDSYLVAQLALADYELFLRGGE